MKKLLLGMGYLTWMVINLAIIYGIGRGAAWLITQSFGSFLLHLAVGMIMLMLLIVLSILCLGLVAAFFGDEKVEDKIAKWLPFIDF